MVSDPYFPTTFDDLRQATGAQRQAIYRRIINDPDVVRELIRGLTVAEADAVIRAFDAAAERIRPAAGPQGPDRAPPLVPSSADAQAA